MKETGLQTRNISDGPRERGGIHRLAPTSPAEVNIYFVERPVPTLIDAPMKDALSLAELSGQLQHLGYSLSDIEVIIVTHPHIDHFGSAGDIVEISGAEVWATDDTARWLENYDTECLEEERFQKALIAKLRPRTCCHWRYFGSLRSWPALSGYPADWSRERSSSCTPAFRLHARSHPGV